MIPTAEDLRLKDSLNGNVKDEADGLMDDLFRSFPVSDDLVAQIGEMNLSMARADRTLARQALFQILNLTTPQDSTRQLKNRLDTILLQEAQRRAGVPITPMTPRPAPVRGRRRARSAEPPETIPTPLVYRPDPEAGNPATAFRQAEDDPRLGIRRGVGRYEPAEAPPIMPFQPLSTAEYGGLNTKGYQVNYLNSVFKEVPNLTAVYTQNDGSQSAPQIYSGTKIKAKDYTDDQLFEIFQIIKPKVDNYFLSRYGFQNKAEQREREQLERFGMEEQEIDQRLVARLQKRGRPKMKGQGLFKPYQQAIGHLMDKPIVKPKPYIQFGRYFLNKERLKNKGFLSLRVASGNVIKGLPTQKVSHDLSKVLLTLIAGQTPSYEDIGGLTQEDRSKLSHICSSCHVDSPAVPHMKGEGEAEMDKFNILRGEIIAGNDAPKIAREFKTMLLKFMNEGRIPRQEGNGILHEMLSLGV
jgi:hypothetical protein